MGTNEYADILKRFDKINENPDYSTPAARRMQVNRMFSEYAKDQRSVLKEEPPLEMALRGPMAKRRKDVFLKQLDGMLEECADIQGIRCPEQALADLEIIVFDNYNHIDDWTDLVLAAAVWILDELNRTGRIRSAYKYLPEEYIHLEALPLDFDIPGYHYDLISSVLTVLRHRNEGVLFVDEADAAGDRKDTEHWRNFEGLMRLLDQEAVDRACDRFRQKQKELRHGYMVSKADFEQRRAQLDSEIRRYMTLLSSAVAVIDNKKVVKELRRLMDEGQDLIEEHEYFMSYISEWPCKTRQELRREFGSRVAAGIGDFTVEDPYEICFAALYLLATGDDAPWLMGTGSGVVQRAASMLPWYMDDEDIEAWMDEKERILEKWQDRSREGMDLYHTRYGGQNIAQIVYSMCKVVPPRGSFSFGDKVPALLERGMDEAAAYQVASMSAGLFAGAYRAAPMNLWGGRSLSSDVSSEKDGSGQEEEQVPVWGMVQETVQERSDVPGTGEGSDREADRDPESYRSEIKSLKKSLSELRRQMREEQAKTDRELEVLRREHRELVDLRQIVFEREHGEQEDDAQASCGIIFPYETKRRIVAFGGHDTFLKEIRALLPGVRFIEPEQLSFNSEIVRNADIVWVQSNCISHSQFGKILKQTRLHGIQLRYFAYASAEKCARQLVTAEEGKV